MPNVSSPSARWQVLAQQKLEELEERLQTIQAMKGILEQTLHSQCDSLEDCGEGMAYHLLAEQR